MSPPRLAPVSMLPSFPRVSGDEPLEVEEVDHE